MQVNLEPLTFEILEGGNSLSELNDAIGRMCEDVLSRDKLTKERCVTVKIFCKPVWLGDLNAPEIRCEISEKVPGFEGQVVRGLVEIDPDTGRRVLLINPGDRIQPNQGTLDFPKEVNKQD
jgi:hypothetical protein